MTEGRRRWLRAGARWLGIAGVVLAVLSVRVVIASYRQLERGDALVQAQDVDAAIVHYRRAARWYAPGNPYVTRALDSLGRIARTSEQRGDRERALFAWRSVRASILTGRSFYVPYEGRLARANEHIAELMASMEPPPVDAGKDRQELKAEHLALLEERTDPHVGWVLVLLLGFVGWVGGAFVFASRAFDEEDRLVPGQAWRWGAVVAVGVGLWVVGMALA